MSIRDLRVGGWPHLEQMTLLWSQPLQPLPLHGLCCHCGYLCGHQTRGIVHLPMGVESLEYDRCYSTIFL